MRHTNWHTLIGLLAAAPLLMAVTTAEASELGAGIQTVSDQKKTNTSGEDQTEQRESSSEETTEADDSGGRADDRNDDIVGSGAPGLELGSDSSETDQVLADFDKNRDKSAESSDDSSNDEVDETSHDVAMPDDTADGHPCEPYPSCARADLGSRDGVDATPFQDVAEKHSDAIRSCYTSELEENTDLSGRLVLKFTVDSDGEPADIQVESSSIDSDAVEQCAVEAVAEWSFPTPSEYGYDSLTVTHPYSFRNN